MIGEGTQGHLRTDKVIFLKLRNVYLLSNSSTNCTSYIFYAHIYDNFKTKIMIIKTTTFLRELNKIIDI